MAGDLYSWLADTAARRAHQRAITFVNSSNGNEVEYTYEHLFERAEQLGKQLEARYPDPGAPVGLLLTSQEDQVLHYLAALSVGVVPTILTPPNRKLNQAYYVETMNEVLRQCEFGALITDVESLSHQSPLLRPYTFEARAGSQRFHTRTNPRESLKGASFLQFSSGTTGIKKGVLVDDGAVIAQLQEYSSALGLDGGDCVVSWLPLYHDMGFIACLNMPLVYGIHTVMIDPIYWVSNPAIYLRSVSEHQGTLSWHPNFAYAFMAQRVRDEAIEGATLSSLRSLVNCSEPVTYESQQAFLDRFQHWGLAEDVFKGCYAMAETTFALTHGEQDDPLSLDFVGPKDDARTRVHTPYVSVGRPLPGVELKIMGSDASTELSEREIGEVWVRSPFNFSGYFNDTEATDRSLVGDWYRTGDLAYRVGAAFYVVGRAKELLIVAGVNVFPQDIEKVVSQVDGVHPGRVSAFAIFDESLQTDNLIVVAESDQHDGHERHLILREIRQRLLAAFQIGNFEVSLVPREWIVKSTSGKVARNANREKWLREKNDSV